jgi:hypothetical protein
LSKLQDREISAAEWDVAVQQLHGFEFGKPFIVQSQPVSELTPAAIAPRTQASAPSIRDLQESVAARLQRTQSSPSTCVQETQKEACTSVSAFEAMEAVTAGNEEEHVVADQDRGASPDVWREIKQKLDMADEVKQLRLVLRCRGLSSSW